jgi:hypothetical protein
MEVNIMVVGIMVVGIKNIMVGIIHHLGIGTHHQEPHHHKNALLI